MFEPFKLFMKRSKALIKPIGENKINRDVLPLTITLSSSLCKRQTVITNSDQTSRAYTLVGVSILQRFSCPDC